MDTHVSKEGDHVHVFVEVIVVHKFERLKFAFYVEAIVQVLVQVLN